MSKVFIEEETLIGIGNAIREKSGTTDLIATTDMATAISNLATGSGELKYDDSKTWTSGGLTEGENIIITIPDIIDITKPFILHCNIPASASSSPYPLVCYYDGNGNFTTVLDWSSKCSSWEIENRTITMTATSSLSFSYYETTYCKCVFVYTE